MARPRKKKNVRIEDPRGIRTLAHPARLQAIYHLYGGKVMTATELAKVAEVTPSAMSYHLRELAKWGVIRRVDDGGDARERRWEAAGENLDVGDRKPSTSRARASAETLLARNILDQLERSLIATVKHRSDRPVRWRDRVIYGMGDLLLTPEEFDEFNEGVDRLMERFAHKRKDAPEGAKRMRFTRFVLPVDDI